MNWRSVTAAVLAFSWLAALAGAQEDNPRTSTLAPDAKLTPRTSAPLFAPEKGKDPSQLVYYFLGLLVLTAGGFYFLKRGLPLRTSRSGENSLNILETKMLGNRQFLLVVKYEDSKMLLGVGPGQIQYLCALDSAEADMEKLMREGGAGPETGPL